ncbi:hypothetical protein EDB84DRAFT_1447003 [Lactarius hengduanensis]|nr:hypothetical protein EDB84DRAFT_1447003 [Lactarius hengduanensis]
MPTTRSQTAAAALVAPGLATSTTPTADDLAPPTASASSLTTLTASAGSLPTASAGNLPATTAGSLATLTAATSIKGAKYDLWCLCKGYSEPHLVSIMPGEYLYNLKKEILQECGTESGPSKGANIMDIMLTKVNIDYSGGVNTSEISRRVFSGDGSSEVLNNTMQDMTIKISSIWLTEPLPHHISVFVHWPSVYVAGMTWRGIEGGMSILDRVCTPITLPEFPDCRHWLVPIAFLHQAVQIQVPAKPAESKILDDHPQVDSVPPLSLLYDSFGYFMDNSSLHKWLQPFSLCLLNSPSNSQ